jgi:aryl-alcohol dehydrogenase (NADP+)
LAGNRTRSKSGTTTRSETDDWAHGAYYQESDFDVVDSVVEVAKQKGVKPAQIALAWMLHKPYIASPIIGATKMSHLEELVAATDIEMSEDDMAAVEEQYQPHPVIGHE